VCDGYLQLTITTTVERCGHLPWVQAFAKACGRLKKAFRRYGHAYRAAGRQACRSGVSGTVRSPRLAYEFLSIGATVGGFDVDLFAEFFPGLLNHALITLPYDNLKGQKYPTTKLKRCLKSIWPRSCAWPLSWTDRMAGIMLHQGHALIEAPATVPTVWTD